MLAKQQQKPTEQHLLTVCMHTHLSNESHIRVSYVLQLGEGTTKSGSTRMYMYIQSYWCHKVPSAGKLIHLFYSNTVHVSTGLPLGNFSPEKMAHFAQLLWWQNLNSMAIVTG